MKHVRRGFLGFKRATALGVAIAATVALAACSTGGGDAGGSDSGGDSSTPVDLRVLMAPINYEVAHIALDQGFFTDEGLNVTLLDGGTAQDNMAQLAGGSADISILSWDATVTATAQGVPVKLIGGNAVVSDEFDTSGVFVRADSGITSIADLKGKTIAFNSLGTGGNVPVFQALEAAGISTDQVTMQAALEGSQVDAVLAADSFYAQISADPTYTDIAHPVREYRAGLGITLWGVDTTWLDSNQDTATHFIAAIDKAIDWYNDPANKQAVLELRSQVTGQPVDKVSTLMVPFDTAINVKVSQDVTDALEKFGLVENPKSVDDILWSGAPRS